jgi:hypothetical protein
MVEVSSLNSAFVAKNFAKFVYTKTIRNRCDAAFLDAPNKKWRGYAKGCVVDR